MKKSLNSFKKSLSSADVSTVVDSMPLWNSDHKKAFLLYAICHHGGKMDGIPSISTSCMLNERCLKRHADLTTICYHCYAFDILNGYKGKAIRRKLELTTAFLTRYKLDQNDIPFLNVAYFRFESFGDLINPVQVSNYYTIARANSHCNFTLWTKCPDIVARCTDPKPDNMRIIYSDYFVNTDINQNATIATIEKYPFLSGGFFVHDMKTTEHKEWYNCPLSCADCLRCYKTKKGGFDVIIEKLK